MKIVFLSFYSGKVNRGVETFVHELSNKLVLQGSDVTVFQTGPKNDSSSYKTITINSPAISISQFTRQALREIDTTTEIVIPTNGRSQSMMCKIWTLKNKKKMIVPGQSGPGLDDRINLFTFPDAFVALTKRQSDWAKNANPLINVVTIPNGVDLNKFNKKVKPLNLNLPKPIILCVAALETNKRLDLAIKAVAQLGTGSLVLVGSGSESGSLSQLGEKLLPGKFKILSLPHQEMPSVYASADLFTFPTVPWESFGIVLLEAMSSGLPVVATDDSIRREIVGEAGLFINPQDTKKYAQVLNEALGRKWDSLPISQAEKFSWDNIAIKYNQLFQSLKK